MGFGRGLDEYADDELIREIWRRDCARAEGKCSYCGRGHGLTPCRYPEQHKKTTPVDGKWHQQTTGLQSTKVLLHGMSCENRAAALQALVAGICVGCGYGRRACHCKGIEDRSPYAMPGDDNDPIKNAVPVEETWKRYAQILRMAWLNPSDKDSRTAVVQFEREHGNNLERHWKQWQKENADAVTTRGN